MKLLATLLTILLLSCTEHTKGPEETAGGSSDAVQSQSSEEQDSVTIGPSGATAQTIISLKSNSDIINKGEIQWYVNDVRADSSKGVRFSSEDLHKGDIVHAVIFHDGRTYRSNDITINNLLPVVTDARLLPQNPKLESRLTVEVKAEDPDGDDVSFRYKWYINDEFAGEDNYLEPELKKGDSIAVEVTPFDNEGDGKSIRLKNTVNNSLPVMKESEPSFDGKIYAYPIKADDPDGDALVYALKEGPEGMKLDPASGLITWAVPEGKSGDHNIKVSISDTHGGELVVPLNLKISFPEPVAADKLPQNGKQFVDGKEK